MSDLITVEHGGGGWAAIPNKLLEDERLPWKAKGLWAYLYSRPSGWQVREADLVNRSTDGRDSVRTSLAALEESGWLIREQVREDGRFKSTTYTLMSPSTEKPMTENPSTEKPTTENPRLSNTEESNTEQNNKESNPNREIFARQAIHWIDIFPERTEPLPKSSIIKHYIAAREAGATEQQLIDAAVGYKHWCKQHDRLGTRYIYSPVSFLRQHWHDWVDYQPEPETRKGSDGLNYLS